MHIVGVEAEAVAHELLVAGLVSLPLRDRAGEQRDGAGAVEADFGALEAGRGGALDRVGETEPAQLAALACLGAACRKAVMVGERERLLLAGGEIAAVIREGERGAE